MDAASLPRNSLPTRAPGRRLPPTKLAAASSSRRRLPPTKLPSCHCIASGRRRLAFGRRRLAQVPSLCLLPLMCTRSDTTPSASSSSSNWEFGANGHLRAPIICESATLLGPPPSLPAGIVDRPRHLSLLSPPIPTESAPPAAATPASSFTDERGDLCWGTDPVRLKKQSFSESDIKGSESESDTPTWFQELRGAQGRGVSCKKFLRIGMENKPMCTRRGLDIDQMCGRKRLKCCHHKPRTANIQFASLPEDVSSTILSKLPLKELVRTSVLSSEWKHMWKICPKLRFDGTTMCGGNLRGTQQHTQEFVDNVNAVLQQCHGKVVEELEIKFEYDSLLDDHLNSWVSFAVSSLTKNLAFDLAPAKWMGHCDGYRFPFELLDSKSLSRLQQIQLCFVSFELPPQFSGFPNLRKLELHYIRVTQKDLQDILSTCFSLEWLSIIRCHLDDELKVTQPLSQLLYLSVEFCEITRIELSAIGLKTLIYSGPRCPIDVGHGPELKDASLYLYETVTLEHALTALPNDFPSVQNLVLHAHVSLEVPWLLEYPCKFSQLRYLQLRFLYGSQEADNILSLFSFLSAAPVIETLELHFAVFAIPHAYSVPIRRLPRRPHNYLKNLYITGFMGCTGQVEFLVHSVEDAAVLEVLTIDPAMKFREHTEYEMQTKLARVIASRCLVGRISPNTKLCIL